MYKYQQGEILMVKEKGWNFQVPRRGIYFHVLSTMNVKKGAQVVVVVPF